MAGLGCINRRLYYFDDFNQPGQRCRHDIAFVFGAANNRADRQRLACRTTDPNDFDRVFYGISRSVSGDTICRASKILTSDICWLVKFSPSCFQIGFAQGNRETPGLSISNHIVINFTDWQDIDR